jgi:hypothetical protein
MNRQLKSIGNSLVNTFRKIDINDDSMEDIRTNLIESIAGVMGKVCEYTNPNFEGFLTGELYSPESSNFVDLCNMSDDFMYDYENGVE